MNLPKSREPSNAYADLIDGLCRKLGVPLDPARHERCEFRMLDMVVTLVPSGPDGQPVKAMACVIELGDLPKERGGELAIQVLKANVYMVACDAPHFSLHPVTDKLLLTSCLSLERHTAKSVENYLVDLIEQADSWRSVTLPTAASSEAPAAVPPRRSLIAPHAAIQPKR